MKTTQNQYYGLESELPSKLIEGSTFLTTDTGILYVYGQDESPQSQSSSGSPFIEIVSGEPNSDSSIDAYRTGRIGIGEPNPEELVDIVGSQTAALGSFKLDYTYDSGYISRVAYGGQKILSEVGVPANTVQGHDLEVFGAGDWANTRAFNILGDLTGVTPIYGGLAYTCGVANFGGSTFGAGMNIYNVGATPADRDFTATLRVNKGGSYQGNISARHKGSTAGEDLQPTTGFSVTANGKTRSAILTPDYFRINGALKIELYGVGSYVPGTVLTDSMVDTGTAPTTLGDPTYNLLADTNGNLVEMLSAFSKGVAPSSATDTGIAGEIRFASGFAYFCVSDDTWERVAIATW